MYTSESVLRMIICTTKWCTPQNDFALETKIIKPPKTILGHKNFNR
jgi:hypothetical protein